MISAGNILDAHVHLPVGEGNFSLQQKRERLLCEMRQNEVSQCIVISDSSIESAIGSMEECVALFEGTENIYVVGGISLFCEFHTQLIRLKKYLDKKLLVGIKLFTGHEAFYLTDGRLKEVYELAMRYNVPVLFHSGWDNSQYSEASLVADVAKKYRGLKLVCCHCFYPDIKDCQLLIEYPNVYFDISSVADDVSILKGIGKEIKKLIESVPERVLFGSDYSGCSQKNHIYFVKNLGLDQETEDKVFRRNAESVYLLK